MCGEVQSVHGVSRVPDARFQQMLRVAEKSSGAWTKMQQSRRWLSAQSGRLVATRPLSGAGRAGAEQSLRPSKMPVDSQEQRQSCDGARACSGVLLRLPQWPRLRG